MARTPAGVLDRPPAAQASLAEVLSRGLAALQAAGYSRMESPAFESLELYQQLYGREIHQRLITFMTDREYALRPDLTAGLCRAVAASLGGQAPAAPVRVASAGLAWRHERIRPLRLREFHQISAERIGDADEAGARAGELELLEAATSLVAQLGVQPVQLRFGHAGVRQGLLEHLTVVTPAPRRALDELLDVTARVRERFAPPSSPVDPHTHEDAAHILEVAARLATRAIRTGEAPPEVVSGAAPLLVWLEELLLRQAEVLGLSEPECAALLALTHPAATLGALCGSLEVLHPGGAAATLEAALAHLERAPLLPGMTRCFSLGASRGSGFYTGMTLELDAPVLGPDAGQLIGGGRYDGAMGQLGAPPLRAAGFAVGVERLLAAAQRSGGSPSAWRSALVVERGGEAAELVRALRGAGIGAAVGEGAAGAGLGCWYTHLIFVYPEQLELRELSSSRSWKVAGAEAAVAWIAQG